MIQWIRNLFGLGARTNDLTDPRWWQKIGWFGAETASGAEVNSATAMTYSAVWAATRLIAGTGGSLPFGLYKRIPLESKGIAGEGHVAADDHPLDYVLSVRPNPQMTAGNFRRLMWQYQVNWGNAVAIKVVDPDTQEVDSLWPIHPSRMKIENRDGEYLFHATRPDGTQRTFRQDEVFHVPNVLTLDGVIGLGTIEAARESIGMGLATERYGANFFGGDGIPRAVV